jgi:hypothetical protein
MEIEKLEIFDYSRPRDNTIATERVKTLQLGGNAQAKPPHLHVSMKRI